MRGNKKKMHLFIECDSEYYLLNFEIAFWIHSPECIWIILCYIMDVLLTIFEDVTYTFRKKREIFLECLGYVYIKSSIKHWIGIFYLTIILDCEIYVNVLQNIIFNCAKIGLRNNIAWISKFYVRKRNM